MKRLKNTQRGVTLIETMVYIALFGIIIGGAVVAAYQIFESSGRTQTHALLQEEGDFLIGKINWTLSGVQSITAPAAPSSQSCTQSNTLSIIKWDTSLGVIVIDAAGGNMSISHGGNPSVVLNNTNTSVNNLSFTHCGSGGANPESIKASFRLTTKTPNGATLSQDFFTTVYLRK